MRISDWSSDVCSSDLKCSWLAVKRMSRRNLRVNIIQAMRGQGKLGKKGRSSCHWMNCRTYIVTKSGQSQLTGTHASPHGFLPLQQKHRKSGALQANSCRQPSRARADTPDTKISLVHKQAKGQCRKKVCK